MSTPVIRVENLSKLYRLGSKEQRTRTLIETVGRFASAPLRNFRQLRSLTNFDDAENASDILWALRDVSFEIAPGEVVGIIGRNGAGKSTLLKILSRIMPPTRGCVEIHGRLASLLEVGTGFHPDLSGRDNVFLNGAILGMTRREIAKKFDEIVAFAEIEKFIDTPVKRYSSGMYVRLAFAVAAHLEPEILVVDEVLSVGDAAFQKKCLGKMKDVSRDQGRTVLFVSHNITAISTLCRQAVYLKNGRLETQGNVGTVVTRYIESTKQTQEALRTRGLSILTRADLVAVEPDPVAPGWKIIFDVYLSDQPRLASIGVDFIVRHNETAFLQGGSAYFNPIEIDPKTRRVRCSFGPVNLALGTYEIDLCICDPMRSWLEEHEAMLRFTIEQQLGSSRLFALEANRNLGVVIPSQQWSIID